MTHHHARLTRILFISSLSDGLNLRGQIQKSNIKLGLLRISLTNVMNDSLSEISSHECRNVPNENEIPLMCQVPEQRLSTIMSPIIYTVV